MRISSWNMQDDRLLCRNDNKIMEKKKKLVLLNWKEINLILEELDLEGSLVQQVYQPEHQIILFAL